MPPRTPTPQVDFSTVRPVGGITDHGVPARVVATVPDSVPSRPHREVEGWLIATAKNAGLVAWHALGHPRVAWVPSEKIRKL